MEKVGLERSDLAMSFAAEALTGTGENGLSDDWVKASGSSFPEGMDRVDRPTVGRYPTLRECREQDMKVRVSLAHRNSQSGCTTSRKTSRSSKKLNGTRK